MKRAGNYYYGFRVVPLSDAMMDQIPNPPRDVFGIGEWVASVERALSKMTPSKRFQVQDVDFKEKCGVSVSGDGFMLDWDWISEEET